MTHGLTNQSDDHQITQIVKRIVSRNFSSSVAELSQLVRIPSVAFDGFDHGEVWRSAEAVAELARSLGVFDAVEIRQSPVAETTEIGQPAVIAWRDAHPGKPTVLLYAHHDVQPPGEPDDWNTPAYQPTVVGERLYGRGSADDKAGVMTHLAAIKAVHEALGEDFGVGVRLFIEGEEEFGSRSFKRFLKDNSSDLDADFIVVADSGNWDETTPALTTVLRGNVTFKLSVRTLQHASHSGMFGGSVPDAMMATVRILNSFWDEAGSVAVDGLSTYSADTPDYPESRLRAEAGLMGGTSTIGTGSIPDRLWYQPAVTVTGIDAPSVANASNTLLPEISVKVSVRLAPGQNPQRALDAITRHVNEAVPFGAHAKISEIDLGSPFLVDTSGPGVKAIRRAMADCWNVEPVDIGIGGSIPFIADLVEKFPRSEILVTGVEDPNSRAHSPNESLHLGGFEKSIATEALFLARLALN